MRNGSTIVNRLQNNIRPICLALCVILLIAAAESVPDTVLGKPTLIADSININQCKFQQIADNDSHIFVLFSEPYQGVLIYDLKGNYLRAYAFHRASKGVFKMMAVQNYLYVADESNNVYVFEDAEFLEFMPKQEAVQLSNTICFSDTQSKYSMRFVSVWYTGFESEYCVVHRPFYVVMNQYKLFHFVILIIGIASLYQAFNQRVSKRSR